MNQSVNLIGYITVVYLLLYSNPSYSRILIGSRLWSIRAQTHRWRQRSIPVFLNFFEFWIWTNQTSLVSIATNQFASFCIDIRSLQCYFRVCQSGEVWNKKTYIKQIDSMLPCVCAVIDHRGRQNVVTTSVTHSAGPRVPLFCSYHILTSNVIYYWTDAWQRGIYLLNRQPVIIQVILFLHGAPRHVWTWGNIMKQSFSTHYLTLTWLDLTAPRWLSSLSNWTEILKKLMRWVTHTFHSSLWWMIPLKTVNLRGVI